MNSAGLIEFTLTADRGRQAVGVRLRRAGERWIAQLDGPAAAVGLGTTARAALAAVLEPLGTTATAALLADVALVEPSLRVLELERRPDA